MKTEHEAPLYKLSQDVALNGMLRSRGEEVLWRGWPKRGMEPANEAARRIHEFYSAHKQWATLPARPFDDTGEFFLPAILEQPRPDSARLPALPKTITRGMPKYRLRRAETFLGGKEVPAGRIVAFLGWPELSMEPVNAEAERVTRYAARYAAHPKRASAPWCLFAETLRLPVLDPTHKMKMQARGRTYLDAGNIDHHQPRR